MDEVLLVEDDETHAFLMEHALRKAGVRFPMRWFSDAQTGLEYLKRCETPPRFVLLDLKLPGMSGFEALASIRADDRYRELTVVIVTSSDTPSDRERASREGAQAFIAKPCSAQDLLDVLPRSLLGLEDGAAAGRR